MSNFHDHYSGMSAQYARSRPRYPRELFEYLAGLVSEKSVAWDCGTGNGQAAISLAEFFDTVYATDPSAGQIANAVLHPKVIYSVARAEESRLPDHSVDLFAVAQALHWFEFEQFYTECRRIAKPGAVIAVWGYYELRVTEQVDSVADKYLNGILEPYWPKELKYLRDAYLTTPFPFVEVTQPGVTAQKFVARESWTRDEYFGYLETMSARTKYREVHSEDPLEIIAPDLRRAWGDTARREVVFPLCLRVGRVE